MIEQEQYEKIDMPFYHSEVAPVLPPEILDFHTHIWKRNQWLNPEGKAGMVSENGSSASIGSFKSAKYMATVLDYGVEDILGDARKIFPDRPYNAVCFGQPTPAVDITLTNSYAADNAKHNRLFPLRITGRDMTPPDALRDEITQSGFFGYKVMLNWVGDDYANIEIAHMIGPSEMEIADELTLVVLLHVPRSGRLTDPDVQKGVIGLARRYPNARIVLAHCGRCYLPGEMQKAVNSIKDLENVYLDTSMVMDPMVLRIVFENIDSRRVLFGTDLPVAAMRGRRVYVMDHWVDLVLEGYPQSDFRVASDNMRATFMVYEIIQAIRLAAEQAGLSAQDLSGIFYNNGMSLLQQVANNQQLLRALA